MLVRFPVFHHYPQCGAFCMCIFIVSEVYFQGKFLKVFAPWKDKEKTQGL